MQGVGLKLVYAILAVLLNSCAGPSSDSQFAADERITSEAQAAVIQELDTDAVNIDVRTSGAVVTVDGFVDGERERQLALDAVRRIAGVEKVVDRLAIRRGGPDAKELRPVEDDVF
jgi:osmotically-inducible protein OsmY